jgi:hypothetical protein
LSPTLVITPWWGPSLGAGFVGMGWRLVGLPFWSVAVARLPLVMVVEPLTPDSDALQVLLTPSAISGPGPMPPGHASGVVVPGAVQVLFGGARPICAELVTDPLGPVVPCVLTVMGPEGGPMGSFSGHWPPKSTAGP